MRTNVCITACGGSWPVERLRADREEILRALRLLVEPESVAELRVLHTRRGTVSGYYTDLSAMVRDAAACSGRAPGVYLTLNPVLPELLARASNHVAVYARNT